MMLLQQQQDQEHAKGRTHYVTAGQCYLTIKINIGVDNKTLLHQIEDDFWDYDHQVDLEAFSSKQLFSELSCQSRRVISTIGSQNEQVSVT